jgi:serpin B
VGDTPAPPCEGVPVTRSRCPLALLCLALACAGPASAQQADAVPKATASFAVGLYGKLAAGAPGQNLFFSPYSLFGALSMAAEGARGETAAQMAKALCYPEECREAGRLRPIHAGVAALNERLNRPGAGHDLAVANALWMDRNTPIQRDYLATIKAHYKASVYGVDFKNNGEQARRQINAWAAGQTRGRIKEILPDANPNTRLVLTNAVYFKGEWVEPFEKSDTERKDFLVGGKAKAAVPMMYRTLEGGRYGAFEADGTPFATPEDISSERGVRYYPGDGGFQVLEMPYKGGLSMAVLLPRSPDGLPALEKALTGDKLLGSLARLTKREVYTHVPKFRLVTGYLMNEPLIALGKEKAFRQFGAEFEGMRDTPDPYQKLHIDCVLHKAFAEVDEQGTEAAAVTAERILGGSAPGIPVQPFIPEVKADHPFLFVIRDRETGTILFMGRVTDPR